MFHIGRGMERNGERYYVRGRGRSNCCSERREELKEELEFQEKGRNRQENALSFLIVRRWEV